MSTLVERDPLLVELLDGATGEALTVLPSVGDLAGHLARHPDEYAVLLGPSVSDEEAAAVAERYRIARPSLGVVLLRHTVDHRVLASAMRAGIREVVASSDTAALHQAVARARSFAEAMGVGAAGTQSGGAPGRVVTVFATKGGVGKSLVATNLAAALVDLGKRVCLVDLDVASGDVAVMLRLNPQHTLADLAGLGGDLDASGVGSLLVEHSPGLSVLAAPVQLGTTVAVERVTPLIEVLRGMVDVLVLDTSGSFDDISLAALDETDLLLLVGTLDIPSLKSLKLATGTLDLLDMSRDQWRLILNRADAKVGLTTEEFEETLGLHPAVTVPSHRDVLVAVNRGEPIVRSQRGHQVSKALSGFAARLADELDAASTSSTAPAAGGEAPDRGRRGRRLRTRKVG